MNSKRRADLQRKLSMGAVPRPPANLADRIKADIPKYLTAQDERERMTWSVGTALRVAASILLLITTAFVTLEIMQPETQRAKSVAARRPVPAVLRGTPQQMAEAPPVATQASDEVRLDIFQDTASASAPASPQPLTESWRRREAGREERAANDSARGVDGGVADGYVAEAIQETRPLQIAEASPAPPPAPPAAVPAPLAEPAPASAEAHLQSRRVETVTVTASAPLIREAYAKELDLQQKTSLFGISIDPRAFDRVRTAIENGSRPLTEEVNVEAIVNYFAGTPLRGPDSGVSLDVEASPGPVMTPGDRAMLRFTIDTPRVEVSDRASVPPAAQDVRIEVEIDTKAVESFRRIGGSKTLTAEPTLLKNSSVTGLYELELKPRLRSSQHVATVRLRYRSVTNGNEHTLTRVIHGRDLEKDWGRSTPRHRLASLGAVFSESLQQIPQDTNVVQRAEELAKEHPKDERAQELATAATAWSGGAP